jgi:hypothetical protein
MIIELNDDDTRLLYAVLLQQAQEHFRYASTSELAERLYKLATRSGALQRTTPCSESVKTVSSVSLVLVVCFCDAEAANFVLQSRAF